MIRSLKLAIVTHSLSNGGAEKSAANLSLLFTKMGHKVHIISVLNKIDYNYAGILTNLGLLKDTNDSFVSKIKRYNLFKKLIREEKFDIIIDNRCKSNFIKEFIISKILYSNIKIINIIHSFNLNNYLFVNKFLSKILYSKSFKLIAVSNEIRNLVLSEYKFKNIEYIPNFSSNNLIKNNEVNLFTLPKKYILFFGRVYDKVKNIKLLIEAFRNSELIKNNIKLIILGDGPDVHELKKIVINKKIDKKVLFIPYTANPDKIIRKALFTVLTSRYEGFPMSIIESLSMGIPVVSVDCKSGPKEIVKHRFNGLLVQNNNIIELTKAFNTLLSDKDLLEKLKKNAMLSIDNFSEKNISKKWKNIFNSV
ncbi:MAG: glycosyltransferase [Flavobacteriaceae bacterium]|nr:glycosyltransferase [Flavobacteriaceae bacterium]|tara:strand:- start:11999 stop:13093 length:1095 start_codon:yes stop_codon:yes gene_type:complete